MKRCFANSSLFKNMKFNFWNKGFFKRFIKITIKFLKISFISFGSFSLLVVILSFTTLPFWLYYWLGTTNSSILKKPAYIVLLSGSGMPSESGLIRTYYTAQLANQFPTAKIIIAMPSSESQKNDDAAMIKDELILRNISEDRIIYENKGTNTRSQALNISYLLNSIIKDSSIVLVTSPEHTYRAVLTFRKAGFRIVGGFPTFENSISANITFDDKKLGGRTSMIPDVGNSITLRYQFWNHLKYEIIVAREYGAIFFYWIKGWI